jgi:hypothetical protein
MFASMGSQNLTELFTGQRKEMSVTVKPEEGPGFRSQHSKGLGCTLKVLNIQRTREIMTYQAKDTQQTVVLQ